VTPRVLVLLKRSSYTKYVVQGHDPRVESLLKANDPTVARMIPSHRDHAQTVEEVSRALKEAGADTTFHDDPRKTHAADRPYDLVVTVGGDGTLLAASHQIGAETPLLGVNSAPNHSVGFFCAAKKGTAKETIRAALEGKLKKATLTRMRVDINEICVHRRVLNEALFCHASPAATSRYILRVIRPNRTFEEEEHRSSGMWIGPAAGSTAAQRSAGGRVLPLTSAKIQFVVREPYAPLGEKMRITLGLVEEGGCLVVRNKMRQAKIFLDGDHTCFDVTIGDVITMKKSDEPLVVLGLTRNGERKK
jgi:NAD+ kinase